MNSNAVGHAYEDAACELLRKDNALIICRNYRRKVGEIDIIAEHQNHLVFVEVKYRKNDLFGDALQALSKKQQMTLRKTALYFCKEFPSTLPLRFDVIGFTGRQPPEWVQNAF